MNVAIIGAGYVGLVSGVCLAARGHRVYCVDTNKEVVAQLNRGVPHIYETGLDVLLKQVLAEERFSATADLSEALEKSSGVIIAVGTPSENGAIDLTAVKTAAQAVGRYIKCIDYTLPVVVKSTVIPGTTDGIIKDEIVAASGKGRSSFGIGMNPEFLREGAAIDDFCNPDRLIIGHDDDVARDFLDELYAPWVCDRLYVNTRTAELIKYANNILLATQISAINEIANLASAVGGIDAMDVVRGVHLDTRWNPIVDGKRVNPEILNYLVPGCGFGGSCLPKDTQALRAQGKAKGLPMSLLGAVLDVNETQPRQVVQLLRENGVRLAESSCLLLGLSFKPGTDDVRQSPSFAILEDLLLAGARVTAHDPAAMVNFTDVLGSPTDAVNFSDDWRSQVAGADCIIVVTKWPEYESLTLHDLSNKVIFDVRRMFQPDDVLNARYMAIGRHVAPETVPAARAVGRKA